MTKQIQGIGSGAAITRLSEKAIDAYGLREASYSFRPGTQSEWLKAYEEATVEQRWIVFPTWAPQYLNRDGALRPLKDPDGILGKSNRAVLVAPRSRFQSLDQRTRTVLSRIDIGIDGVTAMDWSVSVDGSTPERAAQIWMARNEAKVARWFRD